MSAHYASLSIISDTLGWREMAAIVGIVPDVFWQPGDFRGKTKAVHKNHGCIYKSKLAKESTLEDHVKQLLETLAPHSSSIFQLSCEAEVTLTCAAYSATSPPLFFEKSLLSKITALGGSLDIDLYIFAEEKEEKSS